MLPLAEVVVGVKPDLALQRGADDVGELDGAAVGEPAGGGEQLLRDAGA